MLIFGRLYAVFSAVLSTTTFRLGAHVPRHARLPHVTLSRHVQLHVQLHSRLPTSN